jgi:hypothetical protein
MEDFTLGLGRTASNMAWENSLPLRLRDPRKRKVVGTKELTWNGMINFFRYL